VNETKKAPAKGLRTYTDEIRKSNCLRMIAASMPLGRQADMLFEAAQALLEFGQQNAVAIWEE
jgi:hypothetical protein